ncbi:Sensitive to high expression protein 9-like protein, mitochondrial [Psilocybe cubensis]|uniref:Sensitive to high expression protein 9, mitochondrial n=2 Tax=Psilocybe cubensis TaxID=181762 RepID=A0A8H7XR88_PSICU|nr:Sensitive to high expression protein 9-like protein, mitochondrial [Psilocybe cubensis]KAH9480546.1 Sensitive to high expression protein 9-like protein, mitochondrial [Psilocybe cubensis]
MLRSSFTLRRQFSTSSALRNAQRPIIDHLPQPQDAKAQADANVPEPGPSQSAQTLRREHTPLQIPSDAKASEAFESSQTKTTTTDSTLSKYDLELVKTRIREWSEQAAIALRNRADDFTAHTKTRFSQLGSEINRVTGYEEIEALKRSVVEHEERIHVARESARKAKLAYEEAVVQRTNSQREVNDLLQRKSTWKDSDVGHFTTLVKQDHLYEQEEARAKAAVEETENVVDREFSNLLRTILARYHEEQVWSDKIRSASTYGSLAALGLNMLVFIMAIVVVEPWKRRRLAQTFERKIEELSEENAAKVDAAVLSIAQQIEQQVNLIGSLKDELSQLPLSEPVEKPSIPTTMERESNTSDLETRPFVGLEYLPLTRRQLEVAAVGAGAFALGILSSLTLNLLMK